MEELGKAVNPVRWNRQAGPVAGGKIAAENLSVGNNSDSIWFSIFLRSCSIEAFGKELGDQ